MTHGTSTTGTFDKDVRGGLNGERRLLVYYANSCVVDIIHIFDFTVINEHSQILKDF
jgi:hypothetical protein